MFFVCVFVCMGTKEANVKDVVVIVNFEYHFHYYHHHHHHHYNNTNQLYFISLLNLLVETKIIYSYKI